LQKIKNFSNDFSNRRRNLVMNSLKYLIIVGIIFITKSNYSQYVSDIRVNPSGQNTEITFNVSDVSPNNYYFINITISTDGGKTFIKPSPATVSGDVRYQDGITPGRKRIIWKNSFSKNVQARIEVEPFYKTDFKLTNIDISSSDDKVIINYTVKGLDPKDDYLILLKVSADEWKTEYEPVSVSGDIGDLLDMSDGKKTIIWDVYKDKPEGMSELECVITIMKRTSIISDFSDVIFGNRYVISRLSGPSVSIGGSNVLFKSFEEESYYYFGGEAYLTFFPVSMGGYFYYGGQGPSPNGLETDSLTKLNWGIDIQLGIFPLLSGTLYPSIGIGYREVFFEHSGSIASSMVISSFYTSAALNFMLSDYWRLSATYIYPFIAEESKKNTEIKLTFDYKY